MSECDTPVAKRARLNSRNPSYVIVLGDTGAGKSSLLNSLLGEAQVVPTNGMRACTAAIIELAASRSCGGEPYTGEVEFITREDWAQQELELFRALTDEQGQLMLEKPPEDNSAHEAWWRVKSIFGRVAPLEELKATRPGTCAELGAWLEQQLPQPWGQIAGKQAVEEEVDWEVLMTMTQDEVEEVLGITDPSAQRQLALAVQAAAQPSPFEAVEAAVGQTVRLSARTASQLHNLVKPFVDSADTGTAGALWPLVRRVVLRGPWAQHIGDCVLVDAPGVQDENSSRGDMVRGYLRKADAVWLVSNIRRAVNDKSAKDAMPPPLRQRLVDGGRPGALAFIATQTDVLVRSEIAENLHLPRKSSTERCALERNAYTKKRLVMDFYQGIDTSQNPAAASQHAKFTAQSGPQYSWKNCDVIELISDDEDGASTLSKPSWGRGTLLSYVTPDHNKVRAAAQGTSPLSQVLEDVVKMVTAQEASIKRHQSSNAQAVKAMADSVATCRQVKSELRPYMFTLPVFCVSAVDAQKMEGVRTGDGGHVFSKLEDTGIPALRVHAQNLGADMLSPQMSVFSKAEAVLEAAVTSLRSAAADAGPKPKVGCKILPAVDVLKSAVVCFQALNNRVHTQKMVLEEAGTGSKPGQWMLEAIETAKAAQAAEDEPP